MVVRCCVPGCRVKASNGFHSFPANRAIRLRWVKNIKIEHLNDENLPRSFKRVCQNHFKQEDYVTYPSGIIRLKYNTVPTLNLPDSATLQSRENSASSSKASKQTPADLDNNQSRIEVNSQMEWNINNNETVQQPSMSCEEQLKEKIRNLQNALTSMKKKLRYSQKQANNLRKKLNENKLNESNIIQFLSSVFGEAEMEFFKMSLRNAGRQPEGRRFSAEEKCFCLALYKFSPRTYKHLRKFFTLPTKRTLGRHTAQLIFESGINSNLFDYIKDKVDNMADIDRYCILVWDEIALKPHLDYSPKRDVIDGFEEIANIRRPAFATHSLTFMIRGINVLFKQPVAYFYTNGLKAYELAEMIQLVSEAVLDTGLKIIGSTSDQVSVNVSAIKRLMKTKAKAGQLLIYKIRDNNVVHCFDPPHLIKGLRNNLETKNIKHSVVTCWNSSNPSFNKKLNKQKALVATWDDVDYLYKINLRASQKFLPKISDEHIKPNKLKMKVSVAAEVFSKTYGNAMLDCSEKLKLRRNFVGTANLLLFVNDLFDSLNGSTNSTSKNELKAPVTKNSVHFKFWEYAISMLSHMEFLPKQTGQINRSKIFQNCESTIRGYIEITRKCLNLGMTEVSIRNMNQDGLENYFGVIRLYCQIAVAPIPAHFRTAFVTSIINNVTSSKSVKSNCEADSATALLKNIHTFLTKNKANIGCDKNDNKNEEIDENNYIVTTSFDPLKSNFKTQSNFAENQATCNVSSQISKEILQTTSCKGCRSNLQTSSMLGNHDIIASRNASLKYPSKAFIDNVKILLSTINDTLPNICSEKYICKKLNSYLENIQINEIGCKKHQNDVKIKFIKCVSHYGIATFCKNVNRLLSAKVSLDPHEDPPIYNAIEELAYLYRQKRQRIGKYIAHEE